MIMLPWEIRLCLTRLPPTSFRNIIISLLQPTSIDSLHRQCSYSSRSNGSPSLPINETKEQQDGGSERDHNPSQNTVDGEAEQREELIGDIGDNAKNSKEVKVVTSSLRVDAVASAGLNISRRELWELSLKNMIYLNGSALDKKSTKVQEGDIIEVDNLIKKGHVDNQEMTIKEGETEMIKRGRVVVKEISGMTHKGKYRLILIRHKHFKLYKIFQ